MQSSSSYTKYGVNNIFNVGSDGLQFGLHNDFESTSNNITEGLRNNFNAGSGTSYGINNIVDASKSGIFYGLRNQISSTSTDVKFGVRNNFTSGANGTQYGIQNDFASTANNTKEGIRNNFAAGSGTKYGVRNFVAGTGDGTIYGLNNRISNSGSGTKYGVYNNITSSDGAIYGSYSTINTSTANTFDKWGHEVVYSPTTNGTLYGFSADIDATNGYPKYGGWVDFGNCGGSNYGYFVRASNPTTGNFYGIYSDVNSFSSLDYAAYLRGKTYIGGRLGISVANPTFQLQLQGNLAAKPTSALWTVTSDERLKKDIKPFEDGLNLINKINPVWFTYNGKADMPNETGVGTIAQEFNEIAPYMVSSWKYIDTDDNSTDYLAIDYGPLTFVLVNAIKEQQKIIKENTKFRTENEYLRTELELINERLKILENKE